MNRLLLSAAVLSVLLCACSAQPESTASTKEDLITVCYGGPCTITAQPPATSYYMWQPNQRIWPVERNMRFCDIRIPPMTGEIAIYDLPFAPDGSGHPYPQSQSQCAVISDHDMQTGAWNGGWFDWIAFQDYGWASPTGSIRALQIGPGTKAIFGDHPLNINTPDGCALGQGYRCIGVGGNPTFVTDVPDVWNVGGAGAGNQGFYMAMMHIERQ